MFNVGNLFSLGLVFAIFGASISVGALQAIFAGKVPPGGAIDIVAFTNAQHEIFLILAIFSFIALIPTSQIGKKNKETIIYDKGESG